MGLYYESIPQSLHDWILAQKVFWVATAPLSNAGREYPGGPDRVSISDYPGCGEPDKAGLDGGAFRRVSSGI